MSAISERDERTYREHNITRTSTKIVPDVDGKPTPQSRPNSADMQCQCDACRAHRRRNAVTGVASPDKDI